MRLHVFTRTWAALTALLFATPAGFAAGNQAQPAPAPLWSVRLTDLLPGPAAARTEILCVTRTTALLAPESSGVAAVDLHSGKVLWRGLAGVRLIRGAAGKRADVFILTAGGKGWQLDARTGQTLWQSAAAGDIVGVYGDVALFSASDGVTFRSVAGMAALDPETPRGKDALRRAVRASGVTLAPTWEPGFASLRTGKTTAITRPGGDTGAAISTIDSRAVALMDMDGGVGHSVFPKYLVAFDEGGKRVWRFPKKPDKGMTEATIAKNIRGFCPIRASNVVVVWDWGGHVYGLRADNGRMLWKRNASVVAHSSLGHDFVFQTGDQTVRMDSRTGRATAMPAYPVAREMVVTNGRMLLITADGRLQMYPLAPPTATARRSPGSRRW